MTKIEEILFKYIKGESYTQQMFSIQDLIVAMKEYAEIYGKECLEIAASNAVMEREYLNRERMIEPDFAKYFTDCDIIAGDYVYKIDYPSIKNIKLPEHE